MSLASVMTNDERQNGCSSQGPQNSLRYMPTVSWWTPIRLSMAGSRWAAPLRGASASLHGMPQQERGLAAPFPASRALFLEPGSCAQCRCLVGGFPGELRLVAAKVAVGGGLAVDRPQQVERLDDAFRAQVEVLADQFDDDFVG
jgi:hypothetical protein